MDTHFKLAQKVMFKKPSAQNLGGLLAAFRWRRFLRLQAPHQEYILILKPAYENRPFKLNRTFFVLSKGSGNDSLTFWNPDNPKVGFGQLSVWAGRTETLRTTKRHKGMLSTGVDANSKGTSKDKRGVSF